MSKIKIEQLNDQQKKDLKLPVELSSNGSWSVWECEPSIFDWHYDSIENAYVFEGKVKVKTEDGQVEIKAGDYVTFPEGLDCTWEISEKIRKVYRFI
ncbi:MAG: cupin domain-containing protein [Candidatus Omnitrophica bacterium]|nr:cupin domain-containing protein [Candidatus Omnitrophota bacterium]MBU1996572.1 cupin domain-containing protein [Candidatus Omnitrophota bacterium]MBU4334106.1 cupin domain-containing protein [Candidatus Omnitrophota bacterium]